MKPKPYKTILAILVLLGGGAVIFSYFVGTRKAPSRVHAAQKAMTVETISVRTETIQAVVQTMGTVKAARRVDVYPQVNGRVTSVSDRLIPGGHLKKDDTLLRIDTSDYRLQVRSQEGTVAQAELSLAQEEANHSAAKREWELIEHNVEPTKQAKQLATREIQLLSAKAVLSSAQSSLEKAQLDLSRTRIRAPFNAFVIAENVDTGQVVSSQTLIATLVDSDAFWVQVSVPLEKLRWLDLPDDNGKDGSKARILYHFGEEEQVFDGQVIKLLAELDSSGKTAQLLVRVEDPHHLKSSGKDDTKGKHQLPLMLGAYVRVELLGKQLPDAIALPEGALHEEKKVWLLDDQSRLDIANVELLWREADRTIVRGNLSDGAAVITSRIQIPVAGMELRLTENMETESDQPKDYKPRRKAASDKTDDKAEVHP